MLKSIDFWPLVPKKLSVESSINDDVHQKSTFSVLIFRVPIKVPMCFWYMFGHLVTF